MVRSAEQTTPATSARDGEIFYHDDARARAYEKIFTTFGFYPHSDDEAVMIWQLIPRGSLSPWLAYADSLASQNRGKDIKKVLTKRFEDVFRWFGASQAEQASLIEMTDHIDQYNLSEKTGVETIINDHDLHANEELRRAVLGLMRFHDAENLVKYYGEHATDQPLLSMYELSRGDMVGAQTIRGLKQQIKALQVAEQARELYWWDRLSEMHDHGLIDHAGFKEIRNTQDILRATR